MKGVRGRRARRWAFLATFTAAWLAGVCVLVLIHRLYHISFVYYRDGLYQHLSAYRYVCDYLAALLKGEAGSLSIFNYSLGQGGDILTLLNSYDFFDPVCWLTALLPVGYELRYVVMIFAKVYLAGLAFGLYCRERGLKNGFANGHGAAVYCFSTAMLSIYSLHPNFVNWMYFFPLLMAGGERYWRRDRWGLLVAAVFLNAVVNYYTFYINAILFALYVLVRALSKVVHREQRVPEALGECLRTADLCLAGTLLAMVALLPTMHAFINNNRVLAESGYTASMLRYPRAYYLRTLFSVFTAGSGAGLGIAAVCAPALCLLFLRWDRDADLRAALLLSAAMLCVPMAGKILNGFSYVNNRWSFVIAFYAAVALARVMPEMVRLSGWRRVVTLLVPLAYTALLAAYCLRSHRLNAVTAGAVALLVLALVPVALAGRLSRKAAYGFLAGLVAVNMLYQCVLTYVPWGMNYMSDSQPAGSIIRQYEAHSAVRAADLSDGFYRIEESEALANTDGWNGTRSNAIWWSGLPASMMDYYMGFDLDTVMSNSALRGFDGRTQLLETSSVRYFTAPAENGEEAPWGYALREDASDGDYLVYENPNALTIGYVYPGCMLRADYDGLDALGRQQAQMQCAAVDSIPEGQREIQPELATVPVPYEVVGADGATIVDGGLRVDESYGSIRLKADVPADSEVYLIFRGLEAVGDVPVTIINAERAQGDWSVKKLARLFQSTYTWPVMRDRISFNLGSGAAGENEFVVSFEMRCTMRWGALDIVAVPMDGYARQAERLAQAQLQDVRVGQDEVEGTVALDSAGMLQFSIPYSDGWAAWVDGVPAKPIRSNVMYMALPLAAGEHSVRLRYRTPWLRAGAGVSLATLAGLIVWGCLRRRRRGRSDLEG